ncbi:MAG TPA: PH domain-containing protein [Chloroflexi bacterium]|nr:PH domain-containing protein [Chloroflexota bacterium]
MGLPVQLQENETVVRIIKRHPLSLIGRIVGVALLLIVGIALWLWLRGLGGGLEVVLDILIAVGALAAIVYAGIYWYRYENDLWIITNERLIDSTKTTPFNQDIKTATLTNIQDINIRKRGIFQTLFEYGDVICQTASASGHTFEFLGVAKPAEVLDLIDDQRALAQRNALAAKP